MEDNFSNAATHVRAVAALNCVHRLDLVQWRLVAWNDLQFAMKTAAHPVLPFYLPSFLTTESEHAMYSLRADAQRLATGNAKFVRALFGSYRETIFEVFRSLHLVSLLAGQEQVSFPIRLASAYDAEYRAQSIAAKVTTDPGHYVDSKYARLIIIACQLHCLAATSNFALSSVECRTSLLKRAQSVLQGIYARACLRDLAKQTSSLVWAISTFAAHSMNGGCGHDDFTQKLVAMVQDKKIGSKAKFVPLLKAWPWVEHWHAEKMVAIWSEVLVAKG